MAESGEDAGWQVGLLLHFNLMKWWVIKQRANHKGLVAAGMGQNFVVLFCRLLSGIVQW